MVGWSLASEGASLPEVLDGLRATYRAVLDAEPSFEDITAVCTGWSEATLGHLNQISCEDPMTGLASQPHLRTRIADLYRVGGASPQESHAIVVADVPVDLGWQTAAADGFSRTMRLGRLGQAARTVFAGSETVARIGPGRVGVLVERDRRLGRRVALLRRLTEQSDLAGHRARVWIEGLPSSDAGAAMLLDELARP